MFKRLLLSFLVLAGWCATGQATTLAASDVLSRARIYLRDQGVGTNRQIFSDATLLQFLSDGQREANAQNWIVQSSYTFLLVQGTTEYAAPSDFMGSLRLWYQPAGQSTYIKLDQTSMDQLDAQSAGWTAASGTPNRYYLDRSSQTIYFGFYPAPSVALSTGAVIVYYVQQTADTSATTDVPFNGRVLLQPYVSGLVYYIAARGFESVEEMELSNRYYQEWQNFLLLMRQGVTKTPDFNPGFVGQHGSP